MSSASLPRSKANPARPVTGRWRSMRYRGYIAVTAAAILTPRRLICAALAASVGTAGVVDATGRPPAPVQSATQNQPVVVRHALPEGLAEDEVQKWVPNRRVSGRTELKPWQSVDAARARDPEVLQSLLQPVETDLVLADSVEQQFVPPDDEPMEAGSLREARLAKAGDAHAGSFARLNEMLASRRADADSATTATPPDQG